MWNKMIYFTALVLMACLWTLITGQQQPPQPNTQLVCSNKFETAVGPECFDANGVPFSGVIYLMSGNRTGQLPAATTYSAFIDSICLPANQDKLIPCVLQKIQQNNGTQCTQDDRLGVLGRGSQLLGLFDVACGKACETEAIQSLAQCFAVIQVSPEPILGQNASIIDDKYSVVGSNESEYTRFCNNRNKLFSCLGPISTTCPSLLDKLSLIGIDLTGFETLSSVLCNDKDKYLKGLTCLKTQTAQITNCNQQTMNNMKNAWMSRFVTGQVPPSKYLAKLCEVKLTQMDCELQAYLKSCDASTVDLKTIAECTLLPKLCKETAPYSNVYNGMCQKVTTPASVQTVRPTLPSGTPAPITQRPGTLTGASGVITLDLWLSFIMSLAAMSLLM